MLERESFDLVSTGIGALCWLPSVRDWAGVVAGLLKPRGVLFIREGHTVLWAVNEFKVDAGGPVTGWPYFERQEPLVWDEQGTYVHVEDKVFTNTRTIEWNHGSGEIVQALLDVGVRIAGLVDPEHSMVCFTGTDGTDWSSWYARAPHSPLLEWHADLVAGEWVMKEGKGNIPLS